MENKQKTYKKLTSFDSLKDILFGKLNEHSHNQNESAFRSFNLFTFHKVTRLASKTTLLLLLTFNTPQSFGYSNEATSNDLSFSDSLQEPAAQVNLNAETKIKGLEMMRNLPEDVKEQIQIACLDDSKNDPSRPKPQKGKCVEGHQYEIEKMAWRGRRFKVMKCVNGKYIHVNDRITSQVIPRYKAKDVEEASLSTEAIYTGKGPAVFQYSSNGLCYMVDTKGEKYPDHVKAKKDAAALCGPIPGHSPYNTAKEENTQTASACAPSQPCCR